MALFSERLKYLRQQKGISQQELAKQIKCVSKSSINMYERGEREPSLATMEAFADFFNVDMNYLYGKTDVPNLYQALFESSKIRTEKINQILPLLGTGVHFEGPKSEKMVFVMDRPKYESQDDVSNILFSILHMSDAEKASTLHALRILSELIYTFESVDLDRIVSYAEFLDKDVQKRLNLNMVHPYQQRK